MSISGERIGEIVDLVSHLLEEGRGKPLSDFEAAVLRYSLDGMGYKEMPRVFKCTYKSVKQAGSEFWDELRDVLGIEVKKSNCQTLLEKFCRPVNAQSASPSIGMKQGSQAAVSSSVRDKSVPIADVELVDQIDLVRRYPNLVGTDEDWQQLYKLCGNLPPLIRTTAESIVQIYDGQLAKFLPIPPHLPTAVESLLHQSLEQLSPAERKLVLWLLVQPLEFETLDSLASKDLPLKPLRQAWESLIRRELLQKDNFIGYQLHPPLLRLVVAEQFAETIFNELVKAEPSLLHQYPLLQAIKPASWQSWQRKNLLDLVAKNIRLEEDMQSFLLAVLDCLQTKTNKDSSSYAAGNLINLAVYLGLSLTDWDFSGLTIRCADLRQANLSGAVFRDCTFVETIFPEGLTGNCQTALSPNGNVYAVGDDSGRVLVWERIKEQVTLKDFIPLNKAITSLAIASIASTDLVVIASGREIYFKWSGDREVSLFNTTSSDVSCLCIDPNGEKLAAGLADGHIYLWDIRTEEPSGVLKGHVDKVSILAFSRDGQQLASCDLVTLRRMRSDGSNGLITVETLSPTRISSTYSALGWCDKHLQAIEVSPETTHLYSVNGRKPVGLANSLTIASSFSISGRCLAGSSSDGILWVWDLEKGINTVLPNDPDKVPGELVLCADGDILLTNTGDCVQLWNVRHKCCLWETQVSPKDVSSIELDWSGATITSEVARAILQDLGVQL